MFKDLAYTTLVATVVGAVFLWISEDGKTFLQYLAKTFLVFSLINSLVLWPLLVIVKRILGLKLITTIITSSIAGVLGMYGFVYLLIKIVEEEVRYQTMELANSSGVREVTYSTSSSGWVEGGITAGIILLFLGSFFWLLHRKSY
jgi:hypothetical protein